MTNSSQSPQEAAKERPDPEVPEKARRRTYSAAYKVQILREADACSKPGEIGALLRREGLYSSLLGRWRKQRDAGALAGFSKKRGRKPKTVSPETRRLAELERENAQLKQQFHKAETIIEVQKKLSQVLGIELSEDRR